jgi:hypothetical protein
LIWTYAFDAISIICIGVHRASVLESTAQEIRGADRLVREMLGADPTLVDSRRNMGPAREAVIDEAARLLCVMTRPGLG